MFPAPVCSARWDFWGLTACLFGAHSSFPPMHVYVSTDKIKHSMTVSVCYPCICHPLKQITLPASSKLSQLPPPCWLQKLVSVVCSSPGLCTSRWQEGGWEALSPVCSWPRWDSLRFTPTAGGSCTQRSSAGLEGWFVPRSLRLMQLPRGDLRELCWRASKVKTLCERMVQSIHDVIPVFM